jgi:hypothetical protein
MFRKSTFISILLTAIAAHGATLQQLSMDQMSQLATSVVRATVTGSSASIYTNSGSPTIYTTYKLSVTEVWKGAAASEVMLPGGSVDGKRQSFPGVPELRVSGEYILFLWKSPTTGITHTLGLTQGIFDVSSQPDGSMLASHRASGELMLNSTGNKVSDSATSQSVADLKSRVRSISTGGKQ